MIDLSFMFTIFFLTLGPIKTIPAFFRLTHDATPQFRQHIALRATLISFAVCVFIALIGRNILVKWHISPASLKIAGGLILLLSALKIIAMQPQPTRGEKVTAETTLSAATQLALSPLATPVIITPYGVVAIVFYMFIAKGSQVLELQILGMLTLMMVLNYLGMIFARQILMVIGLPILLVIGWVFAVMQAALGIEVILNTFQELGIVKRFN